MSIDINSNEFQKFRQLYGDDLFSFALDRESKPLEFESLPKDDLGLVGELYQLVSLLERQNEGPHGLELSLTSLALSTTAMDDPLLALCLRKRRDQWSKGNSFASQLDNAALRSYPYLLLAARSAGRPGAFPFSMGLSFMKWEEQQSLATAIAERGSIAKLFDVEQAADSHSVGRSVSVGLSTGSASPLQESLLPGLVMRTAFLWMSLREQHSYEAFRATIDDVITAIDEAGETGRVTVPVCMVHRGVNISKVGSIKLEGTRLIPWSIRLGAIVPSEAQPSIGPDDQFNGFVSVTEVEAEVVVAPASGGSIAEVPDGSELHRRLDLVSRDLALSAFLTFDESRAGVQESFRSALIPFAFSGASFSRDTSPVTLTQLSESQLDDFREWHSRISGLHTEETEVGLRRVVSAIVHRRDPIDTLIDAVVCWENLFGDPQGELAFRISTAMSLLLAETQKDRVALQKEIKDLYNKRSRIIHGGTPPSGRDAHDLQDRILEITRDTLRTVYKHHPDVLLKQSSSQELILKLASSD